MLSPAPLQKIGEAILAGTQVAEENAPVVREPIQPREPSFLSTAANTFSPDDNDDATPKNILLQGPEKSGRSSLAMEFAMELASQAECCCTAQQCICRPVALLRPDSVADSFPIPCRPYEPPQQAQTLEPTERIRKLRASRREFWDETLLERIQIHHFGNFRDCLLYLLALQGLPKYEQPYKAIVIDDLEFLVDDSIGASENPMQLSQFLALVFDTVRFLKQRPSVCVTVHTKSQFPTDSFVASFFHTILTVQPKTKDVSSWIDACKEQKVSIEKCWGVTAKQGGNKDVMNQQEKQQQMDWIVANSGGNNHQILWRALATASE